VGRGHAKEEYSIGFRFVKQSAPHSGVALATCTSAAPVPQRYLSATQRATRPQNGLKTAA